MPDRCTAATATTTAPTATAAAAPITIAVSARWARSTRPGSPSVTVADGGASPATVTAHRGAADSTTKATALRATPVPVSGMGQVLATVVTTIIGAENAMAAMDTACTPTRNNTRATANAAAAPRRTFGAAGPPGTAVNPAVNASTRAETDHAAGPDRNVTINAPRAPPHAMAAAIVWSPRAADQISMPEATVTAHNPSVGTAR